MTTPKANPPQLLALVERYVKKAAIDDGTAMETLVAKAPPLTAPSTTVMDHTNFGRELSLEDRLRQLTTMATVVLFMKGSKKVSLLVRCQFQLPYDDNPMNTMYDETNYINI